MLPVAVAGPCSSLRVGRDQAGDALERRTAVKGRSALHPDAARIMSRGVRTTALMRCCAAHPSSDAGVYTARRAPRAGSITN